MKKIFSFLFPIVTFLLLMSLSSRIFSGGVDGKTILLIAVSAAVILFATKPKKGANKSVQAVLDEFLGDYGKDAFADDEALKEKFYAALKDYGQNCPKAALAKLQKLAPLCTGKKEQYAVAMATAKTYFILQKYNDAIREYNRALVVYPTAKLSSTIGDCYQRQGMLDKAREAYEFATELEPKNVDAWCRLATVYVAEGNYEDGLDQALQALELDEKQSSALATAAICYGLMDDNLMSNHYTRLAVDNGYSEGKITDTIKALKKR